MQQHRAFADLSKGSNDVKCSQPAVVVPWLSSITIMQVPITCSRSSMFLQHMQVYSVSCHSNAAQLHCQVAVPGTSVLLTPLYAKRVCQVPLTQSLQEGLHQSTAKESQNGLLSMDQARSLLPLLADDPNVRR